MYTLPGSINYLARAEISASGEKASVRPGEETITVSTIDTNYIRYDITGDPEAKLNARILPGHCLGEQPSHSVKCTPTNYTYLPTNLRRKDLRGGGDADQDIFALYVQYGRYLGMASSRKIEPLNSQGIWNQELSSDWSRRQLVLPLWSRCIIHSFFFVDELMLLTRSGTELAEPGKDTAAEEYNNARAHHNTKIWRDAAPIDSAFHDF
ncbi:hypothetical protein MPER_12383 [Moniliophthora perniciosa FA553]|nr:hypothetical protein MPER_12383 [Moniliophthora perniciosa FA553]